MPRPKGSKNKVKATKVTADFAAQIAAKQQKKVKQKLQKHYAEQTWYLLQPEWEEEQVQEQHL